jgi:hypothetical protein
MGIQKGVHQLFIDFKKVCDLVRREVLYNFLIEFGIPMKLVRVIKMCMNETYNRVRAGSHLPDKFPVKNVLKQGDALLPLIFSFALEYAVRRVQVKQDGLKLNGTRQFLVYADDFNMLGGSVHTIEKNTEALVIASKKTGPANIAKCMVMSRDQNAGRSLNTQIEHSSSECAEEFIYLGTTLRSKILFRKKLTAD